MLGRFKFFGIPRNNRPDNPNTDFNKGKTYKNQIEHAYNQIGFEWNNVIRVWCLWYYPNNEEEITNWKKEFLDESESIELSLLINLSAILFGI